VHRSPEESQRRVKSRGSLKFSTVAPRLHPALFCVPCVHTLSLSLSLSHTLVWQPIAVVFVVVGSQSSSGPFAMIAPLFPRSAGEKECQLLTSRRIPLYPSFRATAAATEYTHIDCFHYPDGLTSAILCFLISMYKRVISV
jgi:hypothetical protein